MRSSTRWMASWRLATAQRPSSISCPFLDLLSRLGRRQAGYLGKEIEDLPVPLRADRPIDRHTLVAVFEPLSTEAVVEIAPARIGAHRGQHVVLRFVEIKMVVLVEDNRLPVIARQLPRLV